MAKKILVVDDELEIANLISERLKSDGYDVVSALDGIDGINKTQEHRPDLIILDIMMPELDGYQVCNNLKFDDKYKHIPILLLTCRGQEIVTDISQFVGISYLQKPFKGEDLLGLVRQILKSQ